MRAKTYASAITGKTLNRNVQWMLLLIVLFVSCQPKPRYSGPLSPEESMKTFHFAGEFKTEVFASEPIVTDPVAMVFDEEGNAYAIEMADAYQPESEKGRCRIVILKDINGDGQADTSIVFADGLKEATSILPWKNGLLIAAAPDIMYYKDTDGDGQADLKEVLFTGFFTDNEEAQITDLRFSIDNWIYANNSGQAGEITFARRPDMPKLMMQGADFRFRLDRDQFEPTTGPGQFGLSIDDWGHRFFTTNSIHIRQEVIPRRYLIRNPFLPTAAQKAEQNISDHDPIMYQLTDAPYWREERTRRRNEKFRENHLETTEYAKDHFTAASGGTIYDGDVFPKEYYGNIFTGDVSGNLVHRDILLPSDTTPHYIAKQDEQEKSKEFLAATDTWFRPVSFSVGPDGYLYMIDIYRQHIEAPTSIPDDLVADMDFKAGSNHGRIYRIVPENAGAYKKVTPNLRNATSAQLVDMLTHQNRWWRLQAQRLLLERQDKTVLPAVKALFAQNEDPRFRLHALYVLEGMNALDATIVKAAMKDASPGVRENAAILSERFPDCLPQLEAMVNDPNIRVAYQAILSLGQFKDKAIIPALVKSLERHGQSSWFRTAVLSSETGSGIELLKALEKQSFFSDQASWKPAFLETYSNVIGARNDKGQVISLLGILSEPSVTNAAGLQAAGLKGLINGLERREGVDTSTKEKLKNIFSDVDNHAAKVILDLKALYIK